MSHFYILSQKILEVEKKIKRIGFEIDGDLEDDKKSSLEAVEGGVVEWESGGWTFWGEDYLWKEGLSFARVGGVES